MKVANTCRLCYEEEEDITKLTSPCDCKGSIEYIHLRCLRLMKREQRYKHQCPTCRSDWKKAPTPGSSKEYAIDLTEDATEEKRFRTVVWFDKAALEGVPHEGVPRVVTMAYRGPLRRNIAKTYI